MENNFNKYFTIKRIEECHPVLEECSKTDSSLTGYGVTFNGTLEEVVARADLDEDSKTYALDDLASITEGDVDLNNILDTLNVQDLEGIDDSETLTRYEIEQCGNVGKLQMKYSISSNSDILEKALNTNFNNENTEINDEFNPGYNGVFNSLNEEEEILNIAVPPLEEIKIPEVVEEMDNSKYYETSEPVEIEEHTPITGHVISEESFGLIMDKLTSIEDILKNSITESNNVTVERVDRLIGAFKLLCESTIGYSSEMKDVLEPTEKPPLGEEEIKEVLSTFIECNLIPESLSDLYIKLYSLGEQKKVSDLVDKFYLKSKELGVL